MSYATYDELITRYPSASQWADTSTMVTNSFLRFAEAELDGLLSVTFNVPFTAPVPLIITDLTIDLAYARHILTSNPAEAKIIRDAVYARIDRIVNGLENIIGVDGVTLGETETDIWSSTGGYQPTNSMLDAQDSEISPELLQAEEDART